MEDAQLKAQIREYISTTQWAILATVREDHAPVMRVMGSFVLEADCFDMYFCTGMTSKADHIKRNPLVSFYFQHEGEQRETFRNCTLTGPAILTGPGSGRERAIELLAARSARFRARLEAGDVDEEDLFYRIQTKEIKYLDYSLGRGQKEKNFKF